jgi:hypothetical protein
VKNADKLYVIAITLSILVLRIKEKHIIILRDTIMTTSKVGLALGSGASRGWAHIGVIEALQDANIPIHLVTGCSVGAFVGAIYASGGLERLKKFVIDMDGESMFSFSDFSLIRSGLLNADKKLKELFCMHSDKKEFEELDIPLKVVAAGPLPKYPRLEADPNNLIKPVFLTYAQYS